MGMNMQMTKECILIMNPAHAYAREFIKRAKVMFKKPIIGLFSLKWRHDDFLSEFHDLNQELHSTICAFDGNDEQKIEIFNKYLRKHALKPVMIIPWDDGSILLAGKISEALSLNWLPYRNVLPFKNKYILKNHLTQNTSLRINHFALASSEKEIFEFQRQINKWPLVLKPVHAGGSWNVFIVHNEDEIRRCSKKILGMFNDYDLTENPQLIVEEYIGGKEYCVNGQTDSNGNAMVCDVYEHHKCVRDRIHPVFLDSYLVDPTNQSMAMLANYAALVIRSCSLIRSPFHIELKVDHEGPCLIEAACRPVGGGIMNLSSSVLDIDLFELALRGYSGLLSFDQPVTILEKPKNKFGAVVHGVTLENGRTSTVEGFAELNKHPCVLGIDYIPAIGQELRKTVNLDTAQYIIHMISNNIATLRYEAATVRSLLKVYCGNKINTIVDVKSEKCPQWEMKEAYYD